MFLFRKLSLACILGLLSVSATVARAANDDLAQQQPKYTIKEIPPAPILTPEEELKTFKLPPGFHVELVASEPLVERPISLAFDPDGRVYVVELRAYMPDANGTGEMEPIGRIARLEDTDGDGKLDKKTIFLDKLVVPRTVGLAGDGVIVGEPPNLMFCKDTNGDGVSDEKEIIFTDFGTQQANPEHLANAAMYDLDNWYYSANWPARFRYSKGKFIREGSVSRGQWGITQDDVGRLYTNSNSSMLHCDFVPAHYLSRNPYIPGSPGVQVSIASNNVFPGRVTPGVNRGYTNIMSLDGYLKTVTAACGPVIYRADKYPAEYRGNAFVCEPSANLISRQVLNEEGIKVKATGTLNDKIDFFCSTDERFRPVNLFTAPDGTIWVLDIYHGILQHKAYLSAYLRDQIKKRDLDKNPMQGRIWRIVNDSAKPGPAPKLGSASIEELVKNLSNPNGWWRDTCQRLLVEKQDKTAIPLLEKVVSGEAPDTTPLGKIHALWVLQGMDKLTDRVASAAAADADPRVRLQALRTGETLVIKNTGPNMLNATLALAKDPDPKIQLQVLFMASPANPKLQEAATGILVRSLSDPIFRSAALNGAAGRELELLQNLLGDASFKAADPAGQKVMLNDLAECVIRGRVAERVDKLFDLISQQESSKDVTHALLQGVIDALMPDPKAKTAPRKLRLLKEPTGISKLEGSSDKKTAELTNKAQAAMTWPNKPGDTTPPLKPLTPDQEKRFATGKMMYTAICAACHQPSGLGQEGTAPPLVDSEWVLGPEDRLARIILCGLRGPVRVGKKSIDLDMPNLRALNDEQISGVLTYIRREWGHEGNPVEPEAVAKIRAETASHGDQFTAEDLLKIK